MSSSFEGGFFGGQCPERFRNCRLETLDRQSSSLIEFGKAWANNPTSVFVYGGVGSGKTHYAFAIVREYIRCQGKWPRFYTSPNLDSILCKSIMEKGDHYLIEQISKEDLLIVDDFGRETKSDRIRRQYFEIFNNRYANNLPTIVTSNYDLTWIGENLGEAIASRFETFQMIRFTGKDLRKQEIVI
jgi:DNA replication protein DnaC